MHKPLVCVRMFYKLSGCGWIRLPAALTMDLFQCVVSAAKFSPNEFAFRQNVLRHDSVARGNSGKQSLR